MPRPDDTRWKRQAALFAAGVSTLIGIGTLITLIMLSRDKPRPKPATKEPPAVLHEDR